MSGEDEDMVRRALEDEAMGYQPSDWAGKVAAVHDRSTRRRRGVRGAVAVTLAVGATAATAVGVALASSPGGAQAGHAAAQGPAHAWSAPAQPGAQPSTSPTKAAEARHPAVRVVPAGKDLNFGHQIWMKLTAGERCEGLGPDSTRAYSCKSVTDGNQPQGTVGAQSEGNRSGTLYSPLYIGPGDVAAMTIEIDGKPYDATVVKLAGHPGYATAYLWVPGVQVMPSPGHFSSERIKVYDAHGKLLASMVPPGA
ncbi:hypothetical protein ABIA32_004803 [Streptacidiphilus sp. MAP12-20]|uniref:hypothetical protein n=1 Tax=Streptacidiphilus sp. MAP12-20 TaxID=3156299 RepID=UPI00351872CC